jgi:hypothetical protein
MWICNQLNSSIPMRMPKRLSLDNKLIFIILLLIPRCSVLIRVVLNGVNILMLKCSYPSLVLYIILSFSLTNFNFNYFFFVKYFMSFYTVKEVLINPSNREELQVDKLTLFFNCPIAKVGTTIEPNVPVGISKMFVFHFFFS